MVSDVLEGGKDFLRLLGLKREKTLTPPPLFTSKVFTSSFANPANSLLRNMRILSVHYHEDDILRILIVHYNEDDIYSTGTHPEYRTLYIHEPCIGGNQGNIE